MAASARCKRVWKRFAGYYGARFVDSYGPTPPEDWQKLIDRAEGKRLSAAMERCRQEHIHHPPTLPEFELLLKRVSRAEASRDPAAELTEYLRKRVPMAPEQWCRSWLWLTDPDHGTIGVLVPAVGEHPEIRVMLSEARRVGAA